MWTKQQLRDFQNAIATAERVRPQVEHLEELSKHSPALADRVGQLRVMLDTIEAMARTALTAAAVG